MLKRKLEEKITGLRAERRASENDQPPRVRKEKRVLQPAQPAPQRPKSGMDNKDPKKETLMAILADNQKNDALPDDSVAFNQVVGFGDDTHHKKRRRQTPTQLLLRAERAKEQEAKIKEIDPEVGEQVAAQKRVSKALQRAAGVRVKDDPALLRKTIKKAAKKKTKSQKEWKRRVSDVKKAQRDKQRKRQENLQARVEAKKAKRVKRRQKR